MICCDPDQRFAVVNIFFKRNVGLETARATERYDMARGDDPELTVRFFFLVLLFLLLAQRAHFIFPLVRRIGTQVLEKMKPVAIILSYLRLLRRVAVGCMVTGQVD